MNFEAAKALRAGLDAEVSRLGAILHAFPKGPMGLTPDAVKASPEYLTASAAFNVAFHRLRSTNHWFTRTFKREIAQERRQRRDARANATESV